MMGDNLHEGHRNRLKKRFAEHGLGSFTDIEAIELLLFYALPRRDTNELAHRLLRNLGSLRAVMEADATVLAKVPGIGENAAQLIRLVAELNRRYLLSARGTKKIISNSREAGEYLLPLFTYQTDEIVYFMSLDSKSMVTQCHGDAVPCCHGDPLPWRHSAPLPW